MPNVIPTEEELLEALKKRRERAANQRAILIARWKKQGKTVMTLELAREIRELKEAHPELTNREISERFDVSRETVRRVLHHTLFPDR